MNLAYNMDFEIASLFFVIILLIYMMIQYPKATGQTFLFKIISLFLILTEVIDIISVFLNAYIEFVPYWICILFNTLYFMVGSILPFLMLQYITKYIVPKNGKTYFLDFSTFFIVLAEASFITNIPGKYYFYFDENGVYQFGPLHSLLYLIQIVLITISGLNIVLNRKLLERKQLFSTSSYVVLILVGCGGQALLFPHITLFLYASALAILILFFSLETPDFYLLNKTLNELKISKKQAEESFEKARVANRAKSDFLSHMSHEIRTPINAIIGLNEMILRESKDETILGYASDSKGAINTLYSLVNEILDFSKIESGKLDIVPVPYYFENIIFDIRNIIYELCSKKNLELIFEIDPNIPSKMLGDEIRIKQIVLNLLTNAVKYTKTGYVKLSISSNYSNEKVILDFRIEDTGIGISNEDLKNLFKPFERLDMVKNRNIEGTGLGLPITRQLLINMGSKLNIESEYGKGSVFSFALEQSILVFSPVGHKDWLSRQFDSVTTAKSDILAPDAKILLVDDNDLNRKVFISLLKETQIKVDEAVDGIECLDKIKNNKYDIIYLDHMMPQMDGMEALLHIKENHLCDNTPIIVLTANAVVGMKDQYMSAGFSDFLAKPLFAHSLENSLRKWLSPDLLIEKTAEIETENTDLNDMEPQNLELPEIDGILWDYGKMFLPLNILVPTAIDYYEALEKTISNIEDLYKNISQPDGMLQYQTQVHSLKSTSAMIGATQISALAKLLEKSAKNNELETINSLTPILLNEMRILKDNMAVIKSYSENSANVLSTKDIRSIVPYLNKLRTALNDFDYDTADAIMSRISENTYSEATTEIEELKQQVINLQSMPALETIEKIFSYIK